MACYRDSCAVEYKDSVMDKPHSVLCDPGQGEMAGSCEHGIEPSGSVNAGNFLTSCATLSFARTLRRGRVRYPRSKM
jgi:hypothetical protein